MKHTDWFLSLALVGLVAFPACSSSNSATNNDAGTADAGAGITSFTAPYPTVGSIERLDPELDTVLSSTAKLEKLAEGFVWSEGPLWVPTKNYLLFTDVPADTIYKWEEGKGISVWLNPAGCSSNACKSLPEPGANGLTLDKDGALVMCQHGDRRVAKLANLDMPTAMQTVVVGTYMGKPFNSPNDLVYHTNGNLFFTDPPYGSATQMPNDPALTIGFQGVYRLDPMGMLHVIDEAVERPNGIALSPDQTKLYVANSHDENPIWIEYTLAADMTVVPRSKKTLFDAKALVAATGRVGGNDGIAVDNKGNLFATGPGGVLIFNPAGKHLGTILTTQRTSNNKFGGADGKTLYITADPYLLRIQTVNAVAGKP